ncbi:MAG: cytochrome c biogenesis protein ResB [Desulfobulbus sp.]|nr:cytochrome c biogenesis protein ResB [Desulfobulbus sp.]
MTMHKKNAFVSLFASVQLALFLLFILAATSIIGTVIPQTNVSGFYVQRYGEKTAQFFQLLDITDMYNSWWFLGLLGLFSLNLIVCSLERIPQVFRLLRRDNLALSLEQLRKMPIRKELVLETTYDQALDKVSSFFGKHRWQAKTMDKNGGRLFAADKGGWSRFGVYVVHSSILIILAGAVIGSTVVAEKILRRPTFAFKGSIMLPEGQSTGHVTAFGQGKHIDLDFQLRCDDFTIEYYPNGMPKTYRSLVSILEDDQVVQQAKIEVNKPLTYKGVTFYQSSYQPFQSYQIHLKREVDGLSNTSMMTTAEEVNWGEAGVSYGIINRESQGEVTRRLKIWFSDHQGEPSIFWVNPGQDALVQRPNGLYHLKADQVYATGLQATKDPGVGLVYGGCLLMLLGLYVAFFLSHRRLYTFVQKDGNKCRIFLAGDANKNKVGFEKKFSELIKTLESNS